MQMSIPELSEYVRKQLGEPFWTVEIDEDQLSNVITDAISIYSRWKPIEKYLNFVAPDGITKLTLQTAPVALPKGTNGLLDCQFLQNLAAGNPDIEAQMLSGKFAFYGVRSPLYDLRFYEYQREWIRFAGKELSSEPEYHFRLNEDTHDPQLWIYSPGAPVDVQAVLSINHTDTATIPDYDEIQVRRLALALGKIMLGRLRSKFETIPAANQQVKLDGEKLLAEGQAELEAVESKLQRSVVDQVPIWF